MAARFQINQVLPEIPRPALPAGTQAPFDGLKCKEIRKSAAKRGFHPMGSRINPPRRHLGYREDLIARHTKDKLVSRNKQIVLTSHSAPQNQKTANGPRTTGGYCCELVFSSRFLSS